MTPSTLTALLSGGFSLGLEGLVCGWNSGGGFFRGEIFLVWLLFWSFVGFQLGFLWVFLFFVLFLLF